MKKLNFILAGMVAATMLCSCGANTDKEPSKADSGLQVIPPPDNSSATNPSMADTNFSKNHADTANRKKDSSNKRP